MKTFKYLIAEALDEKQRYAKETGEKFNTFDQFQALTAQYSTKGNFFLFAQFSSINKLGINPSSTFDTPLGIYSYPVVAFGIDPFTKGDLPFATERQYIIAFTVSSTLQSKIAVLDSSGNIDDAHSGIKSAQLEQMYKQFNPAGSRKKQTTFQKFWLETRAQVKENPSQWAALLRKLGLEGVVDRGSGIVHWNEPTQAVIFSRSGMQHLLTVQNPVARNTASQFTDSEMSALQPLARFCKARHESMLKALRKRDEGAWISDEMARDALAEKWKIEPDDLETVSGVDMFITISRRDAVKVIQNFGRPMTTIIASIKKVMAVKDVQKVLKPEDVRNIENLFVKLQKAERMAKSRETA